MSDHTWLSAYLFFDGNLNHLLRNMVYPFVIHAEKNRYISRFFFIRYSENGTHLRLRMKGRSSILHSRIKPGLEAKFSKYIEEQSKAPGYNSSNRMEFAEYHQETARYGGPEAVLLAEELFHLNSKLILRELLRRRTWSAESSLGTAIYINLSFSISVNMSRSDTIVFFTKIHRNWLANSIAYAMTSHNRNYETAKVDILNTFERSWTLYKNTLKPTVLAFWTQLVNKSFLTELLWIGDWMDQVRGINSQLEKILSQRPNTLGEQPGCTPNDDLHSIYESYLHMSNNRLGISDAEDSYIAFIIAKSLE